MDLIPKVSRKGLAQSVGPFELYDPPELVLIANVTNYVMSALPNAG